MTRCAFIIDRALPPGLIANTAAALSMTLGKLRPELVGCDLQDADGIGHPGITTIVMPILVSDAEGLRALRRSAAEREADGLGVIGMTDVAQRAKSYDDYRQRLAAARQEELRYLGLCLHGPAALVRSLTGSLPLLK
ncbi:hypothetical protein TSH7_25970 [Azospirillum sp. TSH7]|uniref:DUF2000 domain-containing protein n=1 Tax=unclassified Azospirillum TaxID=2630922 RepID=UPI000D61CBC9|nr:MULTISPECIES: DUF2000 domain-containing protein [unclassified Azospirillum]PWC57388.1 hypothetical protein TSH7_25970 [Azospirillum sp. TSH7]PWC60918.1 hypothetical protein TSH20_24400 [Azospirillum sp. TSH20]